MAGYVGKIKINGNEFNFDADNNSGEWEYFIHGYKNRDENIAGDSGLQGNIDELKMEFVDMFGDGKAMPSTIDEINVTPAEDVAAEINSEIENMMRPSDDTLTYSELNDIANEYNVDVEEVIQMMGNYVMKRNSERQVELTDAVKEILNALSDHDEPQFKNVLQYWKQFNYGDDLSWVTPEDLKAEFTKQTVDPNQLSLFENKIPSIKDIIASQLNENYVEWSDDKWKNQMGINDDNLMPEKVIKTFYERIFELLRQGHNIQDEAIQQELNRLVKINGKIPKEIQDLIDGPNNSHSLFEYDDDFDEGPQPGDAEYHYDSGYKKSNNGRDVFANIDWQVFFETLVMNTKIAKDKTEKGMVYNVNDFTDDDGFISPESLKHLEDHDLIYIWNGVPIIDNPEFLDFRKFYDQAKSIWLKDVKVDNSPSQFRYRDDGGTDGG